MLSVQHIHPMLVHFPIVLIILVAAVETASVALGRDVTGRSPLGNLATAMIVLAALAAIASFYFGDIALTIAENGGFESDVAEVHEGLGRFVAIVFSVWAIVRVAMWWRNIRLTRPVAFVMPMVSIVGAGLVVWTAYYGGKLVFDLGVNVAKAAGG
ncbi:MAG: DUF2231 domain-containing protein [Devosia sp.]|nr:DUF2231 domain-containing protein [Devosia sp.]